MGVMVSAYGNLAGQFIASPRLTLALAEQRDFPAFFARVHPRFRTPYVSILVHALLVASLAIAGSFIFNAVLSAAARVLTYAVVCAAVPALRRQAPDGAAFTLPGGPLLPIVGLAFCAVMAANMDLTHLSVIGAAALAAAINWAVVRRTR
jgi:amino acid transporter